MPRWTPVKLCGGTDVARDPIFAGGMAMGRRRRGAVARRTAHCTNWPRGALLYTGVLHSYGMLKQLDIRNLTVFREASLLLSAGVNVIVGVNGSGKTHLLKSIYATIAASAEEGRKPGTVPTKGGLQTKLAEKLVAVFRPESLGRLARRKQGRERCELRFRFDNPGLDIAFSFATSAKAEVNVDTVPSAWIERSPVFFPTRELLTIYPGFVSVYENHYLEFEETWRDTCLLLGAPSLRGPREKQARELLSPIRAGHGRRSRAGPERTLLPPHSGARDNGDAAGRRRRP